MLFTTNFYTNDNQYLHGLACTGHSRIILSPSLTVSSVTASLGRCGGTGNKIKKEESYSQLSSLPFFTNCLSGCYCRKCLQFFLVWHCHLALNYIPMTSRVKLVLSWPAALLAKQVTFPASSIVTSLICRRSPLPRICLGTIFCNTVLVSAFQPFSISLP